MKELQKLMNDIHQWADKTFGEDRLPISIIHHLDDEVDELMDALNYGTTDNINEEFADCLILLLNAASKEGLTAMDLLLNAETKLEVCKKRKWDLPDARGVVKHKREKS
jgi:NTP pyrophosphatase (non-canonical NTP hydrolase)